MDELVSCIMATGNRNMFFPYALRCYLSQTYRNRELIVVDDGEDPVGSLCAGLEGVKYVRLDKKTPTGTKLNLGIDSSNGTILQKLDDDDYYRPDFLETSAGRLQSCAAPDAIVAWACFLVIVAGDPCLRFSGQGWLAGGTLCFRRRVWESTPFRDVPVDEDSYFLDDHKGPRLRVRKREQYVLVRHGGNTWRQFRNGLQVDGYFSSLPAHPRKITELVDDRAARFYSALQGVSDVNIQTLPVSSPRLKTSLS
jgi:glycosyltransferase involved in cell wall biosynthesis